MSLAALSLPPARGGAEQPFCPMIVGKAFLNSPPTKQTSTGQQSLSSFLTQRRERYLARRRGSSKQPGSADVSYEGSGDTSSDLWSRSATSVSKRDIVQERHIFRLASLKLHSSKQDHSDRTAKQTASCSVSNKHSKSSLDDLIKLSSEELAEKVVSRAKVRLKHYSKRRPNVDVLREAPKTVKRPNMATDFVRTSTPVPAHSNSSTPLSLSPIKPTLTRTSGMSLNRSFEEAVSAPGLRVARRVVCFSERQSATCKDTGVPNVPPSTPNIAPQDDVRYVASMSDIKSQRDLKNQLQAITLAKQEVANKEMQLEMEREKKKKREEKMKLKAQQRAEIYALNEVMAKFEKAKFEAFMSGKV